MRLRAPSFRPFLAAGLILAGCSAPGGSPSSLPADSTRPIAGRPGPGPIHGPAPTPAPGSGALCAALSAANAFLGLTTISASGQLSRPTITNSIEVANPCDAPENVTVNYAVTSSDPYSGCGQNVTIPDNVLSMNKQSSTGVSVNVTIPNCPGTATYTITASISDPLFSPPKLVASVQTQFETSDLATKPGWTQAAGQVQGVQLLSSTFAPDAAAPPGVTGAIGFWFNGFNELLQGTVTAPLDGNTFLVGAFVNGGFFTWGEAPSACFPATCVRTASFNGGDVYFLGLNAPLQPSPAQYFANPTGRLLTIGDTIDFYPIASQQPAFGFTTLPTVPVQITGPKLGSATLTL